MRYFDYETIAQRAGIPEEKLKELCKLVRQEFPRDNMMYELHLLRACQSISEGHITLDEAIRVEKEAA